MQSIFQRLGNLVISEVVPFLFEQENIILQSSTSDVVYPVQQFVLVIQDSAMAYHTLAHYTPARNYEDEFDDDLQSHRYGPVNHGTDSSPEYGLSSSQTNYHELMTTLRTDREEFERFQTLRMARIEFERFQDQYIAQFTRDESDSES
jgi:hypothetical protein